MNEAIGIIEMFGFVTAISAADAAAKAADVKVVFVDRFNGTLIISGEVADVETAVKSVLDILCNLMGFAKAPVTKT